MDDLFREIPEDDSSKEDFMKDLTGDIKSSKMQDLMKAESKKITKKRIAKFALGTTEEISDSDLSLLASRFIALTSGKEKLENTKKASSTATYSSLAAGFDILSAPLRAVLPNLIKVRSLDEGSIVKGTDGAKDYIATYSLDWLFPHSNEGLALYIPKEHAEYFYSRVTGYSYEKVLENETLGARLKFLYGGYYASKEVERNIGIKRATEMMIKEPSKEFLGYLSGNMYFIHRIVEVIKNENKTAGLMMEAGLEKMLGHNLPEDDDNNASLSQSTFYTTAEAAMTGDMTTPYVILIKGGSKYQTLLNQIRVQNVKFLQEFLSEMDLLLEEDKVDLSSLIVDEL